MSLDNLNPPDFEAVSAAYITLSIQIPRVRNLCFLKQSQPDDLPDCDVMAAACTSISDEFSRAAYVVVGDPLLGDMAGPFRGIAKGYRGIGIQLSRFQNAAYLQLDQPVVGDQTLLRKPLPDFDAMHRAYVTLSIQNPRFGNFLIGRGLPTRAVAASEQRHLVPVGRSGPFPDLNAINKAYSILYRELGRVGNLIIEPNKGEDVGRQLTIAIRNTDPGLVIKNPPDSQATNLDAVALENDGQEYRNGNAENDKIRAKNCRAYARNRNAMLRPLVDVRTGVEIPDCPAIASNITKLTGPAAVCILEALQIPPPQTLAAKRASVRRQMLGSALAASRLRKLTASSGSGEDGDAAGKDMGNVELVLIP